MLARPRSDEKRSAIMKAAIEIIAAQGTSAPTAAIAKEAGISNGALFIYFGTKADLLNQLYRELKTEMALSTTVGLPTHTGLHDQVLHVWNGWLKWAVANPQKRRVLAHLDVANEVTAATRQAVSEIFTDLEALLDQSRANGPLRDAPLMFVASLVTGLVDATVDYIAHDPAEADEHAAAGFKALWRILA